MKASQKTQQLKYKHFCPKKYGILYNFILNRHSHSVVRNFLPALSLKEAVISSVSVPVALFNLYCVCVLTVYCGVPVEACFVRFYSRAIWKDYCYSSMAIYDSKLNQFISVWILAFHSYIVFNINCLKLQRMFLLRYFITPQTYQR